MNRGFWSELKKPIMVLAPMANVTDAAFRRIIAKYGKPDVFWTEFVSVEGLLSVGREKLLIDFWHTKEEKPIVAQIFGGKPEQFYEVAKLCVELGFDGIDINMGCPDKGVEKSGGGAALIKDPARAQEIILAIKGGVRDVGSAIPVSVKTRLGYNKNELETWVQALLKAEPAVITMHLRTRKEMSKVPAHWDQMRTMVELVTRYTNRDTRPLLFGNGDVMSVEEARMKVAETGADGVMLGRAIFGNPWLFAKDPYSNVLENIGVSERLQVMVEHTKLFEELYGLNSSFSKGGGRRPEDLNPSRLRRTPFTKGRIKPFDLMKKHYKAYCNGFDGAKELRVKLMEAETAAEVEELVSLFLKKS
ncbi:MAG: hypothetical protein COU11_02245 [Candidatus Harrisonbacteria bacterium CG10_big_fil_rev_8_21_14_0_10_49_15]|uniref:tRNA-dihydrouridine synthase n=1 Tax=Candidatus Harrisonbacteria bacterium CG10_big_fil_rev_8_21_14_0_10_49_15 TaxID=1974587 RepID=A0A2H0UKU7_9BACT|nr:MAG: hypothetical protein COU11_02245 [Candidatus Harrisonbacteria bacterium CG10_big_fil_rev_8_21_14_0_10_49_15]